VKGLDLYRRVVAFGAHPDDIEAGAGGLIARLAGTASVTMVVCSIPDRPELRAAEARAGAAALGVTDLVLLDGERASRLEDLAMHELVARFDRIIAERTPELVITHNTRDHHLDHSLVHRATMSALRRWRCDVLAYAAASPLDPIGHPYGGCHVDITTTIEHKLAGLTAHASQLSEAVLAGRRDIARAVGEQCGVRYAEAFEVLRMMI
jgi:LmbE family N-acetylglucosaminyl deacetylase